MGIRFDAGATGDLRLCRRVLPTAMLLVAPWTAGLAACLAAGRLMVRLIFRTRSFRGRRQSSGAAACGSSGLRRPTPGILYITGTVAGIPSVVVSAPVRDARPTLWATAQHTVNGFRKLTPWGSGKFDPPGGRLVAVRAVFLGEKLASLAGAVGIAGQGQDLGVVDESVDHGGGDYVVGEGLSPAAEGQVRGDQY